MEKNFFIHETSIVSDDANIGENVSIWHFSHVREKVTIGKNVTIGQNVYIDKDVVIGNNCKIQNNVSIYKGVTIGDYVFIGPSVVFTNDLYPDARRWTEENLVSTQVMNGVSIGANSTIICGVILHEGCLIGAGSVVTKDIQAGKVAYGNPAKEIKNRKT